jgi:hypothetical protein
MGIGRGVALMAAMALAGGLAGCGAHYAPSRMAAPPPAPVQAEPPVPRVETGDPLAQFYAEVETGLTSSGKMRRDTAPPDAPFDVGDLVHNFERIALYDEYVEVAGRFVRRETPSTLRRWERPVRVDVLTGAAAGLGDDPGAAQDRANVEGFTARLAALTRADVAMSGGDEVNFLVVILDRAEQEAFADQAALRMPGFEPAVFQAIRTTPVDTFCTAYAFAEPDDPNRYAAVLVLIKAEHPALTRRSCVHEEMAQAMGLPNDYADARPSLFNDSLEFAFLTKHDEVLLRMLYDPRLRPGMTAAEARPILPEIAADAMRSLGIDPGPPLMN